MIDIGYIVAGLSSSSPEERGGWEFLRGLPGVRAVRVQLRELPGPRLLWWHFDSSITVPARLREPGIIALLRSHIASGGSLLLTLLGAQYVVDLGLESERPNITRIGRWNERRSEPGYPDLRGLSGFRGHPVFTGLQGAAYTWTASPGRPAGLCYYQAPALPKGGKVVAVERRYIHLDDRRRVMCEYRHGKGRVLTIGAHFYFDRPGNRFQSTLAQFAVQCFQYLDAPGEGERRTYWDFRPAEVRKSADSVAPVRATAPAVSGSHRGPVIIRNRATPNSFDTGGRRLLIVGTERGGMKEVWAHPVRVLSGMATTFRNADGSPADPRSPSPRITAGPGWFVREFRMGGGTLKETVVADPYRPAGAVIYELRGAEPIDVVVSGLIDLRMMWPYPPEATGSLIVGGDRRRSLLTVRAPRAGLAVCIGGVGRGITLSWREASRRGTSQPVLRFTAVLRMDSRKRSSFLAFAGSGSGMSETIRAFRATAHDAGGLIARQKRHWKGVLDTSTLIRSPDPRFNEAYRWAVCSLDSFVTTTPGVGTSAMAGYGSTAKGWDGGHAVNGRPGYAWYFGRDSLWMGLAYLAAGRHETVRQILRFLSDHQDRCGKVLHELTSSGQVHFDAADSTPLYILLLGRYLRATGDAGFVRKCYGNLTRATAFCLSTDTDGDHLIENSNVGHGWIEGGRLFPVHAELYLNACWSAALSEAAAIAARLGYRRDARTWSAGADRVRSIIERKFWNRRTQFYNLGLLAGRRFRTEKTALAAAAASLIPLRRARVRAISRALAGEEFSAPWGVRMVRTSSRVYNPAGYHYGSVWPLFTGWASLAAYGSGCSSEGFLHLRRTAFLFDRFSAGRFPEVLHGEKLRSAGVCDHQGWSAAMVVLPALEGMLGLRTDAPARTLVLSPSLPAEWAFLDVERIRIGNSLIDIHVGRYRRGIVLQARLRKGRRVTLVLRLRGRADRIIPLRGRAWSKVDRDL